MRGLNLDQLRTFAEVVRAGSFSGAAARLNLTQPAVSLQVRQLETRLGVRLVERVGRRATPTAAGRELLVHAGRIEAEVAAAAEAMAAHAGGAAGRVRLGTGATACIYLLPPVLRALRRRLPSLEIVVSTGNTAGILRLLEENALDLGLVTLPAPGRAFSVTPLMEEEFVAVAPAEADDLPPAVTPAALAARPVVLYEPGGHTRRIVDDWFARAGISPKPVMELGSVEAIKELVGAGLGCAVLPSMAVEQAAGLVTHPLSPRLYRRLGLVLRRDKPLSRGLRETVAALQQAAERA
ncbi:LysR family transcriptional regulator [Inquilinus limosus]|uniref:LysR family transcriptional regulator n=1 Tax=Inquilinus limosus TaxID=171674 RepID=UPI00041EDFE1|nr:LysR family transcriptional regulator [Inquilinus limosus]